MKNIVLFGGGRSATSFMEYILEHSLADELCLNVVDQHKSMVAEKLAKYPHGHAFAFDIHDIRQRSRIIEQADLVVSLLPAHLHITIANDCLYYAKNLLTASYHDQNIIQLESQVRKKNLIFLGEMGLDPGIDHMSAMKMIKEIQGEGGVIKQFISGTGGLMDPSSNDNPWHYKFTWNPKNVVLAGKGTAQFMRQRKIQRIPYHLLFRSIQSMITPAGEFEMYPNRDSLHYATLYNLPGLETLLRGTLRGPGYCAAWNALVQIGLTDDYSSITLSGSSYRDILNSFGINQPEDFTRFIDPDQLDDLTILEKLNYLDLLSEEVIPLTQGTPADILLSRLMEKWKVKKGDQDRVVMHHLITYEKDEQRFEVTATLDETGENEIHTAMSKLVGLPLAIYALELISGINFPKGVRIPVLPEIYLPVLKKLQAEDITFEERVRRW